MHKFFLALTPLSVAVSTCALAHSGTDQVATGMHARPFQRFCHKLMDQGDFSILACLKENRPKLTRALPRCAHQPRAIKLARLAQRRFRAPFPCRDARSSRGPSAAEPPFSAAARFWCLPPPAFSSDRPAVTSMRTAIGETRLDGEACDPIVSDGVHEVAVAIRTYSGGRYGKRVGTPVHFQ